MTFMRDMTRHGKFRKSAAAGLTAVLAFSAAPASATTTLTFATDQGQAFVDQWQSRLSLCSTQADVQLKPEVSYDFSQKPFIEAASGTPLPDVMLIRPELFGPIINAGLLENLQPLIDGTHLDTSAWLPGAVSGTKFNGGTWGLPAYVINYTYAYNGDLIDQAGIAAPGPQTWVSWDQARTIAQKTTKDDNGDGTPDVWGFVNGTGFVFSLALMRQAGATIFDEQGLVHFDTAPVKKAVAYLRDMNLEKLHTSDRSLFWNGKAATERMGSWEHSHITPAVKASVRTAAGLADVTKNDIAYDTSWAISKQSPHVTAAWKFISCLTSKPVQDQVIQSGVVPMRRDVTLPADLTLLQGFMQTLDSSITYPLDPATTYVVKTFDQEMADVWTGKKAAENVLGAMDKAMNAHIVGEHLTVK
ncbi:MAG TPA: extracellular solute-binding protein [Limnochordia bacterium]|nr:extracellular solute-binding protein [Limnochordia bacterium]